MNFRKACLKLSRENKALEAEIYKALSKKALYINQDLAVKHTKSNITAIKSTSMI